MAVTSYRAPGTVTVDGTGEVFVNPSNVINATTPLCTFAWATGTRTSEHLFATNFGFTTSDVPSGSTIDGFEFTFIRSEGGGTDNIETKELYMIRSDGTITATNMAITGEWPTTDTSQLVPSSGGATDLWGYTGVTAADVIDTDFGIRFQCGTIGSGTTPSGQFVGFRLRIYYTVGAAVTADMWLPGPNIPVRYPQIIIPYGEL